jgi:hypothetical protein
MCIVSITEQIRKESVDGLTSFLNMTRVFRNYKQGLEQHFRPSIASPLAQSLYLAIAGTAFAAA